MKKLKVLNYFPIIAILLGVMFFTSCEQDEFNTSDFESIKSSETKSRQVSSLQAKAFASMMANNLFSSEDNGAQLKSTTADANRTVEAIQAIVAESKDTVMFSVNFGGNKGFMLISGDKEDAPIVALSDVGSFDINNLNPTVTIWLEGQKENIAEQMKEPLVENDDDHSLWSGILSDSAQVEFEFVSDMPKLKGCPTGENPSGRSTVYPYLGVKNKWGQGLGYNCDAKVRRALAGCPSVAIGQLCREQKFPGNYNYSGMPHDLSSYYNYRSNDISKMFRSIGDKIPGYTWSVNGSGAKPTNIVTGLKRLGYSRVSFSNYNLVTVYNNLRKGNPVLLASYQNGRYSGGHIWFCDGYYEAKIKITHKKWRPFKWRVHCIKYRYDDYLYMNWGWDGSHNGWFRGDVSSWKPGNANFNYKRKMYTNLYPVK